MNLLKPFAPYLLALLLGSGFVAYWNHTQREIGRRDILLAQARLETKNASHRADSLATVYKVDTIRLTKLKTRFDTSFVRLVDSIPVERRITDTIRVPVQVLVEAKEAITACTDALRTCEQRVAVERQRAEGFASQLKIVQAQQPGFLSVWIPRLGMLGAGYAVAKLKP